MRRRRSASEQGMHAEVVRFLNLVTGASRGGCVASCGGAAGSGRGSFWHDEVEDAVEERFGTVALQAHEREHLLEVRIALRMP